MEGLWQTEHHAPDCYQPTVDGVIAFDLLAYYAKDSGRNEVQVHEWNGQLDNPEGLACLNEHNLLKARIAKHISKSQTSLPILVAKLGKILNYSKSRKKVLDKFYKVQLWLFSLRIHLWDPRKEFMIV
jgi:hypothetical protein